MPSYKTAEWSGYKVNVYAERRDIPRLLPLVPYFWDTDINLDMEAELPDDIPQAPKISLKYKWELHDLDNNVVRSGQDSYEFGSGRKHRAIKIGFLKPQQCYRLNIVLTDIYGTTSEPLQIATFTVKDKDEFYTQVLLSLIAIIMGIIIGFVVRGCS